MTAGNGLLGGGNSGNVTLSVDPTVVATLAGNNTFTGTDAFTSTTTAVTQASTDNSPDVATDAFVQTVATAQMRPPP